MEGVKVMTTAVTGKLEVVTAAVNGKLEGLEPWKIVAGTAGVTVAAMYLYNVLIHPVKPQERIKKMVFRLLQKYPPIQRKMKKQLDAFKKDFEEEILKPTEDIKDLVRLPEDGWSVEKVMEMAEIYLKKGEFDWEGGCCSGTVYNVDKQLTEMLTKVYGMAAFTNPLHADAFPGVRKMETEVVRMVLDMFHGDPSTCGCMTTGGTESITLAVKAYRDYGREIKGISRPEMVVPVTAHAAFDKAADMLGIVIRHAPVDSATKRVDISAMRSLIGRNTVMLAGSAPQFPHGAIDDIEAIAELGLRYKVPVHVDCCLGGFLLPFMEEAGFPLKPFDFRVEGVTSISADTHKYGFAPKGSSVILYRSTELRHYQWFTFPDWPGGIYATTTISGSRAGGIIAACWATMTYFGREGYVDTTRRIIETAKYIEEGIRKIPGMYIVGAPEVSVVAFASDKFNILGLGDGMKERGWILNSLQFPSCVHLCVTQLHTHNGKADRFISDVTDIAEQLSENPGASEAGTAAIYGMAGAIPDRSVVDKITWVFLDALYAEKGEGKEE